MSMKSIIIFTSLFLVLSSQNSRVEAIVMAGETDEEAKIETGQSMHDMNAMMDSEKTPTLGEQERQEVPDIQSQRLAVLSDDEVTDSLFKRIGFLSSTDTAMEEEVQNALEQSVMQPQALSMVTNAFVDDATTMLLFKEIGFSPTPETFIDEIENALESFALTLGKLAPDPDLN
jgi:hypothetical protein